MYSVVGNKAMKYEVFDNADCSTLLRIEDREPVCGRDFCDGCGECLHCYSCDPCSYYGDEHRWVVYESRNELSATKERE